MKPENLVQESTLEQINPDSMRVAVSALKNYRETHPRIPDSAAKEKIKDLLHTALDAGTLYVTNNGYVRARATRRVSVVISSDFTTIVAVNDDTREHLKKNKKPVAANATELKELIDPETIHIGQAALEVFAKECNFTEEEAPVEFRLALQDALDFGEIIAKPNRQRQGEKVYTVQDDEFAYGVFPDGGMIFSCTPVNPEEIDV